MTPAPGPAGRDIRLTVWVDYPADDERTPGEVAQEVWLKLDRFEKVSYVEVADVVPTGDEP